MTREEAIEVLENGGWWDLLIPITTIEGRIEEDRLQEALDLALSALRPVSWEQVEKMRGEWKRDKWPSGTHRIICNRCGEWNGKITNFCPHCGAPMTDEAVEMVMKRMEVLNDAD